MSFLKLEATIKLVKKTITEEFASYPHLAYVYSTIHNHKIECEQFN